MMSSEHRQLPSVGKMLHMTFEKWYEDNIPRHAAVLAFYALFAVAPILLLTVEVISLLYGPDVAEAQVLTQIQFFVNSPEMAILVQTILRNILPSSANWWVTIGFILALLYGAGSFFGELKIVLNQIWGVPPWDDDTIWGVVLRRLQAVLMVLVGSLLIICGLVIANWLTTGMEWATAYLNLGSRYATWGYLVMIFLLLTIVFALIYKFVPNVDIAWQDVWIGAAATAVLISITRLLISLYFSYSRVTTMFGAASAIVVILLWVYYSTQIFFLGAEFAYIYSFTRGTLLAKGKRGSTDSDTDNWQHSATERIRKATYGHNGIVNADGLELEPLTIVNDPSQRHNAEPVELTIENIEPIAPKTSRSAPEKQSWFSKIMPAIKSPRGILSPKRQKSEVKQRATAHPPAVQTPAVQTPVEPSLTEQIPAEQISTKQPQTDKTLTAAPDVSSNSVENSSQRVENPEDILLDGALQAVDDAEDDGSSALTDRFRQLLSIPIRIFRPIREVIVAVGVIGAISLAALAGIPFWRKRGSSKKLADEEPENLDI